MLHRDKEYSKIITGVYTSMFPLATQISFSYDELPKEKTKTVIDRTVEREIREPEEIKKIKKVENIKHNDVGRIKEVAYNNYNDIPSALLSDKNKNKSRRKIVNDDDNFPLALLSGKTKNGNEFMNFKDMIKNKNNSGNGGGLSLFMDEGSEKTEDGDGTEIESKLRGNNDPLSIISKPWVHGDREFKEWKPKRGREEEYTCGKWMVFIPKDKLKKRWREIKKLHSSGDLEGISTIKCSTGMPNERASDDSSGVVIFDCCGRDEEEIVERGENIVKLIDCSEFVSRHNPYIYFKTYDQTENGTRATGVKKNYTYKVKVE